MGKECEAHRESQIKEKCKKTALQVQKVRWR